MVRETIRDAARYQGTTAASTMGTASQMAGVRTKRPSRP